MEQQGSDRSVLTHIQKLVAEEHRLFERKSLDDPGNKRLAAIQVELDQCWDLLRQRRAKKEFGENPDDTAARDINTVEGYRQ